MIEKIWRLHYTFLSKGREVFLTLNYPKVLREMLNKNQDRFCKILEGVVFLCLCYISVVYVKDVLEKFKSNDSSFKHYRQPNTEEPTVTICLPNYNYDYETVHLNIIYGENTLNKGTNHFFVCFVMSTVAVLFSTSQMHI